MFDEKPYKLFNGDCLEYLSLIDRESVDAVICDLPYGTTACSWDVVIPFEPMWKRLKRVIKPKGAIVLFGSQPFTSALVASNLQHYKYDFTWNKHHPKGHLNAKIMPLRQHEDILIFGYQKVNYYPQMRKGKMRVKGGGNPFTNKGTYGFHLKPKQTNDTYYPTSVIAFPSGDQSQKMHPNQKPVDLLRYLIRTYTQENEIVLDFTMGSGSTGVACMAENRKFIGIEKDEHYFNIAEARIKRANLEPCDIPQRQGNFKDLPLFEG